MKSLQHRISSDFKNKFCFARHRFVWLLCRNRGVLSSFNFLSLSSRVFAALLSGVHVTEKPGMKDSRLHHCIAYCCCAAYSEFSASVCQRRRVYLKGMLRHHMTLVKSNFRSRGEGNTALMIKTCSLLQACFRPMKIVVRILQRLRNLWTFSRPCSARNESNDNSIFLVDYPVLPAWALPKSVMTHLTARSCPAFRYIAILRFRHS